jgi:hypothetical protein
MPNSSTEYTGARITPINQDWGSASAPYWVADTSQGGGSGGGDLSVSGNLEVKGTSKFDGFVSSNVDLTVGKTLFVNNNVDGFLACKYDPILNEASILATHGLNIKGLTIQPDGSNVVVNADRLFLGTTQIIPSTGNPNVLGLKSSAGGGANVVSVTMAPGGASGNITVPFTFLKGHLMKFICSFTFQPQVVAPIAPDPSADAILTVTLSKGGSGQWVQTAKAQDYYNKGYWNFEMICGNPVADADDYTITWAYNDPTTAGSGMLINFGNYGYTTGGLTGKGFAVLYQDLGSSPYSNDN